MRKWNNILVRIIILLFLLHGLLGSLMLLGLSTVSFAPLSWLLLGTVVLHGILGIFSTISAIKSGQKSHKWYFGKNAAFWTKRISGAAIFILMIFHISAYTTTVNGQFFLKEFTTLRLVMQLLFLLAIFIHLAVSIKSMLIAKGTIKFKERSVDWMLVLSVMTLFFTVAVVAYYIQWQV